jgi:primosomal replication protein N
MALTRIELSGMLVKPPLLSVTPGGRNILRLSVDCGQRPEQLVLDVVVMDDAARDLARTLAIGRHVRAVGSLKAVRRRSPASSGHLQIEVIASEVGPEQLDGGSGHPG